MQRFFFTTTLVCVVCISVILGQTQAEKLKSNVVKREVAFTLDDLPMAGDANSVKQMEVVTQKTLSVLVNRKVPAIGFINESKLYVKDEIDRRVNLLRMWLDAGMILGNHTFSHLDLNSTSIAEYEDNTIQGEVVFRQLLEERGMKLNKFYFRYPYNHTGLTTETKESFQRFLRLRHYEIAPFTIEHEDYMFADVYRKAMQKKDSLLAQQIHSAYLDYLDSKFDYYEHLSISVVGYEVKQIFLIHVNELNADCLDEMIERLQKRGYHFISLEQALEDKAYQNKDEYVGKQGISWLYRWVYSQGKKPDYKAEPDPPNFILELYQAK